MSAFDTARDVRLPGIVIRDVFIDPKQLSPRMKNMVKTMLRSGALKGGWNSKSKQLATKIVERTNVMTVDVGLRGLHAPARHTYSDAIVKEVCALIDVDEALELMDDNQLYGHAINIETMNKRTRDRHARIRETVRTNHPHRWCWMFSQELTQQVADLFLSARTREQIEAAEKLCDMLDNNTPIPITLSM